MLIVWNSHSFNGPRNGEREISGLRNRPRVASPSLPDAWPAVQGGHDHARAGLAQCFENAWIEISVGIAWSMRKASRNTRQEAVDGLSGNEMCASAAMLDKIVAAL